MAEAIGDRYKFPEGFQAEEKALKSTEGVFTFPTTSSTTSSAVQEEWNEQISIINDIMNTKPPKGEDLYELLDALNALIDLGMNGITDENGVTYYLTDRMADALKMLIVQFAMVGIRPDMEVPVSDPAALLTQAMASENLASAITAASNLTYENLGLQWYLYTSIVDKVLPVYGTQFEDLYNYLEITDEALQVLDDILLITTYAEYEEPWGYSMELNNPGDIPPDAAYEIFQYMLKINTYYAQLFFNQYNKELDQAKANAAANGTTVQHEMSQLPGGAGSSSYILKAFIRENEQWAVDIAQIMADSEVTGVELTPTPPDGMTMTEVGEDLWNAKTELDALIEELTAQGADPKMIESLQVISNDIETSWQTMVDVYEHNGFDLGPVKPPTPESIKEYAPDIYEVFMSEFASNFIWCADDSAGSAITHLENAITRFENFNEEQLKQLQKLMVALEQLLKVVGEMMKNLNDIMLAYTKNFAR